MHSCTDMYIYMCSGARALSRAPLAAPAAALLAQVSHPRCCASMSHGSLSLRQAVPAAQGCSAVVSLQRAAHGATP